jgi:hypothetical protein
MSASCRIATSNHDGSLQLVRHERAITTGEKEISPCQSVLSRVLEDTELFLHFGSGWNPVDRRLDLLQPSHHLDNPTR